MQVRVINHTPEPEKMVAIAARMCYSPLTANQMIQKLDEETIQKMVNMAVENHHDSLMEHVTFTFVIEGVSRALSHQLVRHRIATFHQRSQRYVKEDLITSIVLPPSVLENIEAKKVYMDTMVQVSKAYKTLVDMGIPKEDARYLLPNATYTQLIMTMNVRELIHFFGLRLCHRAQEEIRLMAALMLQECRKISPVIFNRVGPNCFMQGKCPEGKMCCGSFEEKQKAFEPGGRFLEYLGKEKLKWIE
jgi:thymidylate synthase (FAD)